MSEGSGHCTRLAKDLSLTFGLAAQEFLGLSRGGQQIKECREHYGKALEALVALASLQTAFITLDEVIKVTNRRVNAIEYVVRPRLEVRYFIILPGTPRALDRSGLTSSSAQSPT